MRWVLLFGAIALAGLVLYAVLAVRLWRRASALLAELAGLGERAAELAALAGAVGARTPPADAPAGFLAAQERAATRGTDPTCERRSQP